MYNNVDYKILNKRIANLHKIMFLEGRLVDTYLMDEDWSSVSMWNHNKKSTAKALRKFIILRNSLEC